MNKEGMHGGVMEEGRIDRRVAISAACMCVCVCVALIVAAERV